MSTAAMNPFNMNMNNFNAFIKKAAEAATCNSECQQQKTSEQLKQTYLNAEANLETAPNQVQVSQKNYITFSQGTQAYNELNEQQLQVKAETIAAEFQNKFNTEIQTATTSVDSYNGLLTNLDNVIELYENYKNENKELYTAYKNSSSDILTNERKTYYQDQGISYLHYIYKNIIFTIYAIVITAYVIFNFIYPSQYSLKFRVVMFIILSILPFVSTWLLGVLIHIIYKIYNLLPKNVHLSL
jgi:hypothetical protein